MTGLSVDVSQAQQIEDTSSGVNIYARTNQGKDGLDVSAGYSTLGALFGVALDDEIDDGFLFFDGRGHVENDGSLGFNTHLGLRWVDWGKDRDEDVVWGVHAGLDGREVSGNWFWWCNVGVERLTRSWDLRANGYIACGDGAQGAGMLEATGFDGNDLLVSEISDVPMSGFDIETGGPIASLLSENDLYGAIEGFYFFGDFGDDAIGGRARLRWDINDNFALGARGGYDTLFHTSALANLTLRWGAAPKAKGRAPETLARLIEPIDRQELVPVNEDAIDFGGSMALVDDMGNPVPFIHVDNSAGGGGTGTFEDRFDAAADVTSGAGGSTPGDVIVVHAGDGTTTNYDTGLVLQDDQILLGAGFAGFLDIAGQEIWFDPAKTGLFGKPVFTNPAGSAIDLANRNTIAFVTAQDSLGDGIHGENIEDLTLADVWLLNNTESGLFLDNTTGDIVIRDSGAIGNLGMDAVNDGGGYTLLSHQGSVLFDNIDCNENGSGGFNDTDCLEVVSAPSGTLDVVIRNSRFFDNNGDAVEFHQAGTGAFTALVENNIMRGNTETGVGGVQDFANIGAIGPVDITIRNNLMTGNGFSGIALTHFTGTGPLTALIEDNVIDGNGFNADSVGFFGFTAGVNLDMRTNVSDIVIRNNVITNSIGPGIGATILAAVDTLPGAPPDSITRLLIEDNTIVGNAFGRTDDYIGGVFLLSTSVTIPAGPFAGTYVGRLDATVRNNFIDGNNGFGVSAYTGSLDPAGPGGILCANINGNTGTGDHLLDQSSGLTFGVQNFTGGGTFFNDPATGGNSGAIATIGTIGSAKCNLP